MTPETVNDAADKVAADKANSRMDKWLWILIFGGLIACGLGIAVERSDAATGWAIGVAGVLALATGITMLWMRSRSRVRRAR